MSAVVHPTSSVHLDARRSVPPQQVSSIRRKPQVTYISPSSSEARGPTKLLASTTKVPSSSSSSSSRSSSSNPSSSTRLPVADASPKHMQYSLEPALPLYHPFGRLALSLPPLDPSFFGLPVSITVDDDSRRSSSRSRRSGHRLRDAAVETDPTPPTSSSVSTITPTAPTEIKEKASPRKRRAGGGGGKRKRKEPDDGDATYPAKRTRQPRGAANHQVEERGEGDSSEGVIQGKEGTSLPGTPTPEIIEKPERRTTRSRGALVRRDSTASETTSTSVPASGNTTRAASAKVGKDTADIDRGNEGGEQEASSRRSRSKEEGEVSEENKSA